MKTLTAPVSTEAAAAQSGWTELVDLYLKKAISTPWGSTDKLRLCTVPGGLDFFTPQIAPEAAGNRGVAQAYNFWPLQRERIQSDANFTTDRMGLAGSNVTQEWAQMLADVDWYDVPVIVRKVPLTVTSPTADDCVILFSGYVDSARVSLETVQLACSNDMSSFQVQKPAEAMHANCRFRWGDDYCTKLRFHSSHYKAKTCSGVSTTTIVRSGDLNEDLGSRASYGTDHVNPLPDASIVASSQMTGHESYRIRAGDALSWIWDIADWGDQQQGVYRITPGQEGIYNATLKPYVQIDFGVARAINLFRFTNGGGVLEEMPRLLAIWASEDKNNWNFGRWVEIPPNQSQPVDAVMHWGYAARYWRICQRSRWAESKQGTILSAVEAYEQNRNYWAHGRIKFGDATATVALRGVSRTVLESYSGEVYVMALPATPVAGDTFTIERGCPRHFNGCAERLNTENYGGFDSLPAETVPR